MSSQATELEQLRGFVLCVAERVLDPGLAQHLGAVRRTSSLRGLREAARDMVEACQDLSEREVAELDHKLSVAGLPTLSAMRDRRHLNLLHVLAKQRVESEEEFRLLSGYLSDWS
jgi:hypothetical protein